MSKRSRPENDDNKDVEPSHKVQRYNEQKDEFELVTNDEKDEEVENDYQPYPSALEKFINVQGYLVRKLQPLLGDIKTAVPFGHTTCIQESSIKWTKLENNYFKLEVKVGVCGYDKNQVPSIYSSLPFKPTPDTPLPKLYGHVGNKMFILDLPEELEAAKGLNPMEDDEWECEMMGIMNPDNPYSELWIAKLDKVEQAKKM